MASFSIQFFEYASLLIVVLISSVVKGDEDPLRDYANANFTSADFVLKRLNLKPTFSSAGGSQHQASVEQFPGLSTLGTSMNQLTFLACGVNTPHVHPRATEFQYIFQGTMILGIIDTNSTVRLVKLTAGDVLVVPRGLLHYEQNIGRTTLISVACFNSELPGTLGANAGLRTLPTNILASTFGKYNLSGVQSVLRKAGTGNITPDPICLNYFKTTKNALFDYSKG